MLLYSVCERLKGVRGKAWCFGKNHFSLTGICMSLKGTVCYLQVMGLKETICSR